MKRILALLALLLLVLALGGGWYLYGKQPSRQGLVAVNGLKDAVTVRYDERGVPHIRASNDLDLYRALGYVHAQDRLFQMEIMRRLARGELAEVLGPKLVDTDKLFRSLRIRERAASYAASLDRQSAASQALQAYLDGINQYQDARPHPVEFDVLGITPRPFTVEDTISVAGYMAYSFAAAFRTEPLLTYIRDQVGPDYLDVFDLSWQPKGMLTQAPGLSAGDWQDLNAIARLSEQALADNGLPQMEGSNAWVVDGTRDNLSELTVNLHREKAQGPVRGVLLAPDWSAVKDPVWVFFKVPLQVTQVYRWIDACCPQPSAPVSADALFAEQHI